MKCISFNVNSVRIRLHQLQRLIDKYDPDFIGLQETKVTDVDFPVATIEAMGYRVQYLGQKTHYGVALLSKYDFKTVQKGFPTDDSSSQKRFIAGTFDIEGNTITVMNGYFPQGESNEHPVKYPNKRNFYRDLQAYIENNYSPDDTLLVIGDMNISPQDIDIGIGEDNRKRWLRSGKCSFLPEEREWLDKLMSWGLTDTFRGIHGEQESHYSWFDYRSKGFEREPKRGLRIDLILASKSLADKCIGSGIDTEIRAMEKPSDHCPIWAEFS
ncbi:exodeoxyribonuclease III [Teredinibacter haidensis]|uniref:exodeoxyribonuclease III n=1 Tax=Teredinibacter haidensis TaxID=2731755 RepID=UPI00163BE809|nr:exodeoxyribonuclease III [Teredinibacter haidensis]